MPLCKHGPAPDGRKHPSLKDWQEKYRFFSHALGHKRGNQDCMFFDNTKSEERFKTFDGAEAQAELNFASNTHKQIQASLLSDDPEKKVFEPAHHTLEATLGRILEVVEAMNPNEKPLLHPKYKYFGGGGQFTLTGMSDRFERSAIPEDDELQVYKATRDAIRPHRPQTAPAGGRSASVGAATPPITPSSLGKENQRDVIQSQDAKKQEEVDFLKADISEAPSRIPLRPKSASVSGSSRADHGYFSEAGQARPPEVPQLPLRPKSASVCGSSKSGQGRPAEVPPRPKSASVSGESRSSFQLAQMAEARKALQRPKSAIAFTGSMKSASDDNRSANVPLRPKSAISPSSSLARSHSCSTVSSCKSMPGSKEAQQRLSAPVTPVTAEWLAGNINNRPRHEAAAFPKRFAQNSKARLKLGHSKIKARAKQGQEFFPLCKDFTF